ncbi:hypothetical protein [Thalassotalea sp. ND16A]|uniref:hypothetical protein n=1 Tax=Thalassotalea sp. ND16A TaxID=1535422 RepID=UPI00051A4E51|nr:hypothetical protein [Thalassotalea sp. ND16A]KGJ87878.1 hypothetical protein ND16A_2792 [Thalassotalea sp. ND16A]
MNIQLEQKLIENISQLLKRSIVADSALGELRADKKANFTAIFPKDAGFKSTADSFQPYIEEIADELLIWQQNKDQQVLVTLVKKIEKLFKVMAEFEGHYQQK